MPNLSDIRQSLKSKVLKPTERAIQKLKYSWVDYDLWRLIHEHPWLKSGAPQKKAIEWYRKSIMTDRDYHYRGKLLQQGKLYMFDYDTPKYADTLAFFDTQPLVISIGPIVTSEGVRDLGLNMHLLPPRIRRIVMCQIFEMYRNRYRDQLFAKKQDNVPVKWQAIVDPLRKYGLEFCIRMYIPELRKNVIEFRYDDWKNAIYIESKGYKKITVEALQKEWASFVRKNKDKRLNDNWQRS